MNVKEWLSNFEFQEVWDCMQAHWPTASGVEEQYRDLFSVLKSVNTTAQRGDKVIYLGFNNEGEIDNRLRERDFYEPTKDLYSTDIWEFASQTASRNMQDEAICNFSDVEFAAALLRHSGDAIFTSVPYMVPELKNPFEATKSRLHQTRLAPTAGKIADNWDLWYSVCGGVTFSNKRRAMKFKECFLHSRNLMKREMKVNHNITKEVVAALDDIECWLCDKTIERQMMFIYIHPQNKHQAELWASLVTDRFPFCECGIITDDLMQADATRLNIFADIEPLNV